jgi:two-component system, chemotaxis family, chemotaxis protein CheY
MKVLVVDDSRAVHAFMKAIFAGTGHDLTHVTDGSEAVKLFESNSTPAELVLLDWEMPVMTGPETLEAIRKINKAIPIIMVTTKNDVSSITQAIAKGATEYVMKPFTKDILLEKIATVFNNKVA